MLKEWHTQGHIENPRIEDIDMQHVWYNDDPVEKGEKCRESGCITLLRKDSPYRYCQLHTERVVVSRKDRYSDL